MSQSGSPLLLSKLQHGYQKKPSKSIKEKMKIFEPQPQVMYLLLMRAKYIH